MKGFRPAAREARESQLEPLAGPLSPEVLAGCPQVFKARKVLMMALGLRREQGSREEESTRLKA
jgi:hypothetical protein